MERRFLQTDLRFSDADSGPMVRGYAAKFNSLSEDLGGFRERVAPGAFFSSLQRGADVRCLMNHDPNLVLGRSTNGTLKVSEDNIGLQFSCLLPDTSYARDLRTLIKRGDVSQCSFAFTVDEGGDDYSNEMVDGERCAIRTLRSVSLLDASVVTYPAYRDTSVSS